MIAGVRLKLATVCFCLLAVAASLGLHASVPLQAQAARATPAPEFQARQLHFDQFQAAQFQAAQLSAVLRSHPASPAGVCPAVAAPPHSAWPALNGRVFLEDTIPPSSAPFKIARADVAVRSAMPVPAGSPAPRSSFASLSNRQRAP
jgi:hypothetical protein